MRGKLVGARKSLYVRRGPGLGRFSLARLSTSLVVNSSLRSRISSSHLCISRELGRHPPPAHAGPSWLDRRCLIEAVDYLTGIPVDLLNRPAQQPLVDSEIACS